MSFNSFGRLFRITTYGESHGSQIGVIIDGCPPGIRVDEELMYYDLNRRRPGQSAYTTTRSESDEFHITSGLLGGVTTGAPIHIYFANQDKRSHDYDSIKHIYRPSHADYTYEKKYGIRDHHGGGRSSARETVCRVAAGAIAKQLLSSYDITIKAWSHRIGQIVMLDSDPLDYTVIESNPVRCPNLEVASAMQQHLDDLMQEGDTCGGVIRADITSAPAGIGSPIYEKLESRLAHAMLSINACVGFSYGDGFDASEMKGSQYNDAFISDEEGQIKTMTNHSGGIQGGIANGMPIRISCAFKPISSIKLKQKSVTSEGQSTNLTIIGRHDPCVVPRAVPIVEAMAALVITDEMLVCGYAFGLHS